MKLTWLGTGSAFTYNNSQTNALIEFDNGYKLLVDCGGDVRRALMDACKYGHRDINGVYISHLHADHIGGMEWLAFASFFDPGYDNPYDSEIEERKVCERTGRPQLFVSEFLADDLWNRALSAGLASLQGQRCTIDTYFDVHPVEKNGVFQCNGTEFRLVQTIHFVNGCTFELSFGLLFDAGDEVVFITTDTQFAPNQIKDFYDKATIIFHDAECSPFKSGVHSHFDELVTLDDETKAKLWLVHYQDDVLHGPALLIAGKWEDKLAEAGFRGFVTPGQSFEF